MVSRNATTSVILPSRKRIYHAKSADTEDGKHTVRAEYAGGAQFLDAAIGSQAGTGEGSGSSGLS